MIMLIITVTIVLMALIAVAVPLTVESRYKKTRSPVQYSRYEPYRIDSNGDIIMSKKIDTRA